MTQHYNRFSPTKGYDRHLFNPDRILQSAEFNELQSASQFRLKRIADVLLRDGDIRSGAGIVVDLVTGKTTLEAGSLYLDGAIRDVAAATLTIPLKGTVTIGVFLVSTIVTSLEDPDLLNPAAGTRGYNEPGADRLKVEPVWGVEASQPVAAFYPVYSVIDGNVRQKTVPPSLDVVSQAIAEYDRDSTDGCYVVNGLGVELLSSDANDRQIFLIGSGRARVNGQAVSLATSRRVTYDAEPDTRLIQSEPHQVVTSGRQRINVNRPAIAVIVTIQVTRERTVDVTHGGYVGAPDALPDASVISIVSVKQGKSEFTAPTDYKLTAGAVDWSPAGAEPAVGSTYTVTYRCIDSPVPIEPDERGFSIEHAVPESMVLVSYRCKLPRIDRICLDEGGSVVWQRGVATLANPMPPTVPGNLLPIAIVEQTWLSDTRVVSADGPRMMSMRALTGLQRQLDHITSLVAEQRLLTDARTRDQGIQRGVFVDPFLDDSMRDAGIAQTAAIVSGELILPLVSAVPLDGGNARWLRCPSTRHVEVAQGMRTGAMAINPYGAQLPMPATVQLSPAEDRWTETDTRWASPVTERIQSGLQGNPWYRATGRTTKTTKTTETSTTEAIWTLRERDIAFTVSGFGNGERLVLVTFDGLGVTPVPLLTANAQGVITGTIRIPQGVRAGRKSVVFVGEGASMAESAFYGEGVREIIEKRDITTIEPEYELSYYGAGWGLSEPEQKPWPPGWSPKDFPSIEAWATKARIHEILNPGTCILDPLAQTFRVTRTCQLESVTLHLVTRGAQNKPVLVQVRTTSNGLPTGVVLAEAHYQPVNTGEFDVSFTAVATLYPGLEYALVVLTDDQAHALAIATLGDYDSIAKQRVTAQAYDVGVLLSSSNAVTWTPHQDKDLFFRLNIARYVPDIPHEIPLGKVTLDEATDLQFLASCTAPTPAAFVEFFMDMPDGTVVPVADLQSIQLSAPVSGEVTLRGVIHATSYVSGIAHGQTSVIAARLGGNGTYYTRAISAGANVRLRVVYDAVLPAGASVRAEYQLDSGAWLPCANATAAPSADGAVELTSVTSNLTAATLRVRLTLTGSPAARPRVRNLRVIVTE